jgi:tetratricopeptide (TPR) repeat protein
VEIVGLEPRRSDLARGIVIARSAHALDATTQKALWDALSTAGVTETADDDTADEPARRWHAAPWLPPAEHELDGHRVAVEAAAARFELDGVWFIKVETGIDGVAWLELAAAEAPAEGNDDDGGAGADPAEVVGGAVGEGAQEVLYAAPDAPATDVGDGGESVETSEPDEGGEDEDETEAEGPHESHWRNGPPPVENTVPFPVEQYPEILEQYDWESFGIAIKLAGTGLPGEESVINAFFALWLSVYQDERVDEFEPFQRADAVHDRMHRAALMWVEQFAVPATASDQVHFLMWLVGRLHDILPIAWARFVSVDDAMKAHASGDGGEPPFILAGNPFAERFRHHGEEAALSWGVAQSAWSRRELAAMLVELALEHDPDEPATAATAERLLRRALSFDTGSDATGYLAIVLIRQRRYDEAIALARGARSADVRLLVIGEIAEHAPSELPPALALLEAASARDAGAEQLSELAVAVARHAPAQLGALLERLPKEASLVPHLYNASFSVDRPQGLQLLRTVLALPEPARDSGEGRTALVMAWNNACIHAHALGDYALAVELADGGQPFGPENPYIYHSAACAYAAVGDIDRALDQVGRAIEHEYEHIEKMETDPDLSPLHHDPRFGALFNEWRTRRADLN